MIYIILCKQDVVPTQDLLRAILYGALPNLQRKTRPQPLDEEHPENSVGSCATRNRLRPPEWIGAPFGGLAGWIISAAVAHSLPG